MGMDTQDRNRAKITKAAQYIEDNLSEVLRASDIAKHANLSPFHFQRLFAAYMGEPISQYIVARRLEKAALELKDCSKMNILQLALGSGFHSHSAFSKAFKKQFGVSPSIFRNSPDSTVRGVAQDRQFLVSAPPSKAIEAVDVADLGQFHLQYRESFGTHEGQFFRQNDQDIGQQFSALLAKDSPPDMFLMSCFPNTPQNLNDANVPIWFGGAYSIQIDSDWGHAWHHFDTGTWAVFEHWGDYRFLYQTWNQIYRNWLPHADYVLRNDMPFESYVTPSDPSDHSRQLTRIYVPIKKA
ncbi:helix-turn-helix domain-containing protein [Falsiruegeria litorea]|uniref:helix-turn-helix domain-containing protein n=2 Tax=Falsiruegeria litorea TaxID=1280831 RepID=UPI001BEC5A5F|nr:AraC family transcriptional regulator [Falsiruegeria litorea]